MFTNISELRDFIVWAKKQQIQVFKVGEVEIQFSALSMLGPEELAAMNGQPTRELTPAELEAQKKAEEDILFHSSN